MIAVRSRRIFFVFVLVFVSIIVPPPFPENKARIIKESGDGFPSPLCYLFGEKQNLYINLQRGGG